MISQPGDCVCGHHFEEQAVHHPGVVVDNVFDGKSMSANAPAISHSYQLTMSGEKVAFFSFMVYCCKRLRHNYGPMKLQRLSTISYMYFM